MLSYEGCGARLRNCKRESSSRAASRKASTHFRWLSNRPLDPSWWCLWYWWNLGRRRKYFFGEVPRWWYWWYSAGKVPSQSGRVGQDEKKCKSWCCQGKIDISDEPKYKKMKYFSTSVPRLRFSCRSQLSSQPRLASLDIDRLCHEHYSRYW